MSPTAEPICVEWMGLSGDLCCKLIGANSICWFCFAGLYNDDCCAVKDGSESGFCGCRFQSLRSDHSVSKNASEFMGKVREEPKVACGQPFLSSKDRLPVFSLISSGRQVLPEEG